LKILFDMILSNYTLSQALEHRREIMTNPSRVDYRDRHCGLLEPRHRMAFMHFNQSGILVPFSHDTSHFIEPNRLLFSAEGRWLTMDHMNPLNGWAIPPVQMSGKLHGVDPDDIFGCLFFHVKDQFKEFARRIRDFNINIHLAQYDARVISQAIPEGIFQPFGKNCFDRIETSNLADYIGIPRVLGDWAPLLNRRNKHAALLLYSMNWHQNRKNTKVSEDREATGPVLLRVADVLGLRRIDLAASGEHGRDLIRVAGLANTLYDNNTAFQGFLNGHETDKISRNHLVRLRSKNRIQTKRWGIPINEPHMKVPDLSKKDFYDLYCLGAAEALVRFLEFEAI